ncbi:MAG: hypothetical protein LBQ77_05065 [Treponema sp.]|jgi:hypothetical protein|nr:hypothetical protein [Treponema sp.]
MGIACVSKTETAPDPRFNDKEGILIVEHIPENFIDGIILVSGGTVENPELFRYSPKTLQRISNTTMEIAIYSAVAMVQNRFSESGEYFVTVVLYTNEQPRREQVYRTTAVFINGCASVDLNAIH